MSLSIVFAGTSDFAVQSLLTLLNSSHSVIAVYTQPDRPAGRGLKLTPSAVKKAALEYKIPIFQPASLRDPEAQEALRQLKPDLIVVVVYGLLLPKAVLDIPRLGCLNVHPSSLPRWRGPTPIQRAIEAGDVETGVTIMQLDEGCDTGDILSQHHTPIYPTDNAETLSKRLAGLGAGLLLTTIDQLEVGQVTPLKQNESEAIYAPKLEKTYGNLDWQSSAVDLERKIRALNSWPVAYTHWEGETLRIWQAEVVPQRVPAGTLPGTLIDVNQHGLDIATGEQILRLITLQLPGGKAIAAHDFINAKRAKLIPFKTIFTSKVSD